MENYSARWLSIPEPIRDDLLAWYNRSEPDEAGIQLLTGIWDAHGFRAWACPACGDRVYEAHVAPPGTRQNDRVADPGHGPGDMRCGTCRRYGIIVSKPVMAATRGREATVKFKTKGA